MRQISILYRIIISVVIAVTFIGATATYFVHVNYNSLVQERRSELKRQVEIVISMVVADREKDKLSGKKQTETDVDSFKRIAALQFGNNNYFHVYEGTVVRFHGGMPHLVGKDLKNVKDTTGQFLVRRTAREVAEKGESSFQYTWPRKGTKTPIPKIGYNHRIPGTNYWVGTGVYIDDLNAVFWRSMDQAFLVTLLLTFLLAVVSFYVSRSITQPLFLVKKRMIGLAEGDDSSPVPEIDANDEVGEMARAVEVFRKNKKYTGELEVINSQIEQQALHDSLTGLANRRYFETHFARLKEELSSSGDSMMLMHIDLDRFKEINDTLGHAAGDVVLKHTANILKQNVGEKDFISRIGGDEFLIIGPYAGDLSSVETLARAINTALAEPLPYEGRFCRFGASIGIAFEKAQEADIEAINDQADMALYRAKELGRNRFEIYSHSLKMELINRSRTIEEFLDGMDMGQLSPYYQPQFDIHTGDIVGLEVLARWIHPEKGVLAPECFLDIAEDQKVLANINQAIVIQCLRDCVRMQAQKISVPRVSVNFSSDSLKDPELCNWLEKMKPFPVALSVELVGTSSFEDGDETVARNLARFKDLGIEIEIDDFGSGQASILGLLQVKPDRIKIDQKLIAPIPTSLVHEDLVRSIVDMARSIKVPTIAEGVETMEHLAFLKDLGVDAFQGYVLAKPMQYDELLEFLTSESWRDVA